MGMKRAMYTILEEVCNVKVANTYVELLVNNGALLLNVRLSSIHAVIVFSPGRKGFIVIIQDNLQQ